MSARNTTHRVERPTRMHTPDLSRIGVPANTAAVAPTAKVDNFYNSARLSTLEEAARKAGHSSPFNRLLGSSCVDKKNSEINVGVPLDGNIDISTLDEEFTDEEEMTDDEESTDEEYVDKFNNFDRLAKLEEEARMAGYADSFFNKFLNGSWVDKKKSAMKAKGALDEVIKNLPTPEYRTGEEWTRINNLAQKSSDAFYHVYTPVREGAAFLRRRSIEKADGKLAELADETDRMAYKMLNYVLESAYQSRRLSLLYRAMLIGSEHVKNTTVNTGGGQPYSPWNALYVVDQRLANGGTIGADVRSEDASVRLAYAKSIVDEAEKRADAHFDQGRELEETVKHSEKLVVDAVNEEVASNKALLDSKASYEAGLSSEAKVRSRRNAIINQIDKLYDQLYTNEASDTQIEEAFTRYKEAMAQHARQVAYTKECNDYVAVCQGLQRTHAAKHVDHVNPAGGSNLKDSKIRAGKRALLTAPAE